MMNYFIAPAFSQARLRTIVKNKRNFNKELSVEDIFAKVESVTGASFMAISGRSRTREFVVPRQLSIWFLKNHTSLTLCSIGRLVNRDHSTVLYSLEQAENLISTDKKIKKLYEELKEALNLYDNNEIRR